MKWRLLLTFLAIGLFVLFLNLKASAASSQIFDGQNLPDIIDKIMELFKKIAEPIKEILKTLGNFIVWILELLIKLIKWALSYS